MNEKDIILNLVDACTTQARTISDLTVGNIEKVDKYNKRFFVLAIIAIISAVIGMTTITLYFVHSAYDYDYEVPDTTITNTNTNTNGGAIDE